ncbi:MAG: hypothetical protein CVV64_01775 [Candidatus Wallbacteria bacterium HGW-Wallbacteria-1]|jgi:hypothetical protein|uniref:PDZ domain-containing protein n=1 Tax=Candidatus Wallbacteria bacterium HGW-Wallbacteria-1 TaxID=2013854 RepID=A0A2N1PV12_9BACT|nr:MAG: hypothetical protein CVV64_01775 [Candidatus Wallbacteria bacterium HGW-Wallbacteria-1]
MRRAVLVLAVALVAICNSVEARIFRSVDKFGVVHFTNEPDDSASETDMDFEAVKLKEPRFEVKGAWDTNNQVSRTFQKIYDRLHQKRLLDEEELRQIAEQKKAEEEARKQEEAAKNGTAEPGKDGEKTVVEAVAGADKDAKTAPAPAVEENLFIKPWWGLKLRGLSQSDAKGLNMDDNNGVLVTEVYSESPAAAAGIYAGQVIVELNVDNRAVVIKGLSDFTSITVSIDKSVQVVLLDPTSGMNLYKPLIIKNIPKKELAADWL